MKIRSFFISSFFLFMLLFVFAEAKSQSKQKLPCSDPIYRQFDFWLGNWDVYGKQNKKAGDSKISILLDSCIILEEWTSVQAPNNFNYTGKSFNTYNSSSKQWQQTWVDNAGGTTEYLKGKFENNKMVFTSVPFAFKRDSMAVRRLTFFNLGKDKVRQWGEISKDNEKTWNSEYDLEYRRKE